MKFLRYISGRRHRKLPAGDPQAMAQHLLAEAGQRIEEPLPLDRAYWLALGSAIGRHATTPRSETLAWEGLISVILHRPRTELERLIAPVTDALILNGHLDLSGHLLKFACHNHPRSVHFSIHFSKYHFRKGELALARRWLQQATTLAGRSAAEPLLTHGLAYRSWPVLEQMASMHPAAADMQPSLAAKLRAAQSLLMIRKEHESSPRRFDERILCINLDRDPHRFNPVRASFAELGYCVERSTAVYGDALPNLQNDQMFKWSAAPNSVGCFLSHMRAWERIAEGGQQHVLVIEDDALPTYEFDLGAIIASLPAETDYCFVNERILPAWTYRRQPLTESVALSDAWCDLPAETRAPGTDGYILSKRGAEKLLSTIRKHQIHDTTDWSLCALGLLDLTLSGTGVKTSKIQILVQKLAEAERMHARALTIPAVAHRPLGFTPRMYIPS